MILNLPMFRGIDRFLLAPVVSAAQLRHVRRAGVICRRGESLQGLLALGYGRIKLSLRGADGKDRVFRIGEAGETFCDAAALLGRPCPLDAVALVDSLVIALPGDALWGLISTAPPFARAMVGILAGRALDFLAEVEHRTTLHGIERVAWYFESIAQPLEGSDAWLARLPAPKNVIASRLGMKKETLSRLLRELSDAQVISVDRREITILDHERLVGIAHPTKRRTHAPYA